MEKNFTHFDKIMGRLLQGNPQQLLKLKGNIFLAYDGWDDDARQLIEIKEVCEYMGALIKRHPTLLWFQQKTDDVMIMHFIALIDRITVRKEEKTATNFEYTQCLRVVKEQGIRANEILLQKGVPVEECVKWMEETRDYVNRWTVA